MMLTAAKVANMLSVAYPLSVVAKRHEIIGNRPIFGYEVNPVWIPILDKA